MPPRREVTCRFLLVPWRLRLGWVAPLVLLLALAGQHLFVAGHRIPLDMVYFAPGQYKRGGEETPLLNLIRRYIDVVSDLEAFFEEPPQTIKIEAFLIDPNEVTNKDFGRFLESGEVRAKEPVINDEPAAEDGFVPSHWQDSRFNGADQPVVGVDWHVAAAYCRWLDKRLPSGDEWERAARGTTGRLFPWGNDFDPNAANTGESPERAAVSVGRYAGDLSPDGVHDMAGNVREWTLEERQIGDRPGRVIRGAAWNSTGEVYGLAHVKFAAEPAYRSVSLGFRCARNAGQSAEVPSGMVFVPGGTFKRGSEESVTLRLARRFNMSTAALERLIGEKPFEVDLAGFAIDALEVTNADYRRFLEAGDGRDDGMDPQVRQAIPPDKDHTPDPESWRDPEFNGPARPVVGVDWYDALAYCAWRGQRLPSEAEWERAARGLDGRRYAWGDSFEPDRCNTADSSGGAGRVSDVGSYPACVTADGVYDLVGNADEWTATRAEASERKDRRILRGGSWQERGELRGLGHFSVYATAGYRGSDVGFRCAADPGRSWLEKIMAEITGPSSATR